MSVAIAELSVSVNQDLFRPKGDPAQNGLFEEAMREINFQEEISFQNGELTTQNLEQVESDSLLDGSVNSNSIHLMDGNSKDSKETSFFVNEQEYIKNTNESVKINQDTIEHQHNNVQDVFSDSKDAIKPFIIEQQQKRTNDNIKDSKIALMLFAESQEVDHQSYQKHADLDDSIVKNASFSIEAQQELSGVSQEVDTKISASYFVANFMVQEKNNADLTPIKKENSVLKNVERATFQANGAEFLEVNNKSEVDKLFENEAKEFLRENTHVETLKLMDQKNINQQSKIDENKPYELIDEKPQADDEKLTNQLLGHNRELQSKVDTQPKLEPQSAFSALTSSNNSKEFALTNQNNVLNQTNEQNKPMIGLKIGNITNQDGVQSLKISILPHELGTIKLDLKTNAETKLTEAHFTFSHQDGFDLFQGNRQDLLALLGKSGLDIQPDKVSFDLLNFSDSSSQFAHEHQKNAQDLNQKTHFFNGVNNEPLLEEMKYMQNNAENTSLLNLMV
jgi:hypothetical protein